MFFNHLGMLTYIPGDPDIHMAHPNLDVHNGLYSKYLIILRYKWFLGISLAFRK